jgi:hypothetical protein
MRSRLNEIYWGSQQGTRLTVNVCEEKKRESNQGQSCSPVPHFFRLFSFLRIYKSNQIETNFALFNFQFWRFDSSCHANGCAKWRTVSHTQQISLLSKQSMQVQGFVCLIVRTFSFYLSFFFFSLSLAPDKDSLTIFTDLIVLNRPLKWVLTVPSRCP